MPFNKFHSASIAQPLPGRATAMTYSPYHALNHHSIEIIPKNMEIAYFAMGCFWGVERLFWQQAGVYSTSAGYCGGVTPNPTYEEVCSGRTGHAEAVRVVFDPQVISYSQLLTLFWENHDPAQGMRQGNDMGSQYRSAIYTVSDEQDQQAMETLQAYQNAMKAQHDSRAITTEIAPLDTFYFAEDYHQQYLYKNPNGYCGLGGIGICLPPSLNK
ncbi:MULTISPECIES: peptide-methionine (S)-S-oxide reductase MsrA [Providencia]|mgnify:CR=1 FL=1|uniref:Peptide methionine sulfoxide reductase MsrA n=1 Tax=Providencia rettgeri TaxID=587 RepID=A0A2A5Q508_PRORE|nr:MULTISPECIES: peptide-methionine (S)-S-oxide reductase MsrA [Providencia]EFE52097.1 peptide-methionine (S)-S-oxide reductase [Providencia rettgeri DSM 1131]EHZ6870849.1 peptide-methionine (S)-S-oxide reductase MsrA [Providencia rettgeri]MBG5893891.1 peptide-methionine (S)-S-oxide reductase MsrA [Providencia rettgeri]MBI6190256.1 peptide-methionine (S)-S-oxide reductase MsrA [Providencia rettgeri]MBJ9969953.1 peptide-methionine (S)-S-oxide reductase MsrA [Providencia rettgeri]